MGLFGKLSTKSRHKKIIQDFRDIMQVSIDYSCCDQKIIDAINNALNNRGIKVKNGYCVFSNEHKEVNMNEREALKIFAEVVLESSKYV